MEMKPLDPFYVEMDAIPMFHYDPANSSLIQTKKEEILRLRLSWAIRSASSTAGYPDWVDGLKSTQVREKWLTEAKENVDFGDLDPYSHPARAAATAQTGSRVSRKMWQSVIDELGRYVGQVDGRMQPGPLDGVTWVGDGLVGQDLTDRLLTGSEALEKLARKEGNWHPGTEGRVLNLIDPSMHALIKGQTQVLKRPFSPNKRGLVSDLSHFPSSSTPTLPPARVPGFQWLPADVDVGLDGNCHFRSYVNNLDPSEDGQMEMYGVLEEILSTTFVPLWSKLLTHMRRKQNQSSEQIDPVDLKGRKIQVMVRMATTHLTPDNPSHSGGRWHVDGAPEEKIVAVGLHYYSNQNITSAKLGLGEKFRAPLPGWRGKTRIRDSRELVSIETKEGHSLVFSNQLNHRVPSFELENPALPGHRKILAFFLVDPGTPIISTARVPCQQWSFYLTELKRVFSSILPPEIVEIVASYLDNPMDLNTAKQWRDVVRDEKNSIIVTVISGNGNETTFRVKASANLGDLRRLLPGASSGAFRLDGSQIQDSQTPAQLGMETGDVIKLSPPVRRIACFLNTQQARS